MRHFLFGALFCFLSASALSDDLQDNIDQVDEDKKLHFKYSAGIGAASQLVTGNTYTSLAVCGGVGLAKEIYDEIDYGGFSKNDMLANAIGCVVGVYGIKVVGWSLNLHSQSGTTYVSFNYPLP